MKKFYFLLILLIFLPIKILASSSTGNFNVNLEITNCDNDNVCDISAGENFSNCSNDCPASCNNNSVCEAGLGETVSNCSADCSIPVSGGGGGVFPINQEMVLNVLNLSAQADDASVNLSWEVIDEQNYGGVLIKRSELFIPKSIDEGGVLYKGLGKSLGNKKYFLKDINLINGQWYFYTIFLFNKNGQYASGASVSALPQTNVMKEGTKELIIPPEKLSPELSLPIKTASSTKKEIVSKKAIFYRDLIPILPVISDKNEFLINIDTTTTIIIKKENIPDRTESVIVTIENNLGFNTFFLKKQNNGDYSLTVPVGVLRDKNKVFFTFIDKNNKAIDRLEVTVSSTRIQTQNSPVIKNTFLSFFSIGKTLFMKAIKNLFDSLISFIGLMINLAIWVLGRLKYWVYILGVLVIHM